MFLFSMQASCLDIKIAGNRTTRHITKQHNMAWANDLDQSVAFRRPSSSQVRKENSRFLNIFSIIDIPNTACQSSLRPLRELNGTCYHPNQCSKLGGLGLGKCADGFGVCCHCNLVIKHSALEQKSNKKLFIYSSTLLRWKDETTSELL